MTSDSSASSWTSANTANRDQGEIASVTNIHRTIPIVKCNIMYNTKIKNTLTNSRTLISLILLTIKWKLHCGSQKQKRKNKPITMFDFGPCDWLGLPLLTPTTQFSLDHKRRSRKQNQKKWKRSDSSDSDSVVLMTPLTTPIFDFHYVISYLMTPTTTPSLVKTSLKSSLVPVHFTRELLIAD